MFFPKSLCPMETGHLERHYCLGGSLRAATLLKVVLGWEARCRETGFQWVDHVTKFQEVTWVVGRKAVCPQCQASAASHRKLPPVWYHYHNPTIKCWTAHSRSKTTKMDSVQKKKKSWPACIKKTVPSVNGSTSCGDTNLWNESSSLGNWMRQSTERSGKKEHLIIPSENMQGAKKN